MSFPQRHRRASQAPASEIVGRSLKSTIFIGAWNWASDRASRRRADSSDDQGLGGSGLSRVANELEEKYINVNVDYFGISWHYRKMKNRKNPIIAWRHCWPLRQCHQHSFNPVADPLSELTCKQSVQKISQKNQ